MTFDRQIDFGPASRGSAATALQAERRVTIVRKLIVARAFADSAGSTTAMRLYRSAPFGPLWATPWADSDNVLGSSPVSNHDIGRTPVGGN